MHILITGDMKNKMLSPSGHPLCYCWRKLAGIEISFAKYTLGQKKHDNLPQKLKTLLHNQVQL